MTRTGHAISKCFFWLFILLQRNLAKFVSPSPSPLQQRLTIASQGTFRKFPPAGNLDQDPDLVSMYILCSTLSCYISLYLTRPKNLVGLLIFFVYLWFVHNPGREDNKQFKKFQVFIPPVWQIHGLWQLERGCSEKFPRKQILGKRQHCVSGIPTTIELARILLFWNINFCLEI